MAAPERLALLKADLGYLGPLPEQLEFYMTALLAMAEDMVRREGETLNASLEDDMFVAAYAAWLYRKRASDTAQAMPRMLRWQLNNRIVGEKMEGDGDGDDI